MLPEFLLTETTVREAGTGPELALGEQQGGTLVLTLGITRIIEQESIDVSIWGSADGTDWGAKPLAAFPQKFYCGTYQILLDLSDHPDVKYLRAKWAGQPLGQGRSEAAVHHLPFRAGPGAGTGDGRRLSALDAPSTSRCLLSWSIRTATAMITREQALDLFRSDDLIGIGMEADRIRRHWHPEGVVSYIIDRNINYTNFCTEYCTFCAFYRAPGSPEGYILPKEVIFEKIQETLDLGGTGVLMQGGLHPDLKIEWYEDLFRSIKQRYPIHLHCLSAPEVTNIAEVSGLTLRDTIARLRDSGLDSIPGGGAEILDDEVRHRISRLKCGTQEWLDVHRTAHQLGMRTTATMMFGCGETLEQRMNHLELVRNLQEETGGFTAFIPWTFQRENTSLGRFVKEEATAVEYLQTLAICRIYLDNFENVQSSWVTQGLKTCQMGLRFGGNDVGSIMIEENVVSRRRRPPPRQRRRTAPHHPRRRLRSQAARHALPHVFLELDGTAPSRSRLGLVQARLRFGDIDYVDLSHAGPVAGECHLRFVAAPTGMRVGVLRAVDRIDGILHPTERVARLGEILGERVAATCATASPDCSIR